MADRHSKAKPSRLMLLAVAFPAGGAPKFKLWVMGNTNTAGHFYGGCIGFMV